MNQLLADLKNYDFVKLFPQGLNISFDVPVENSDLANLKAKIENFLQQHPTIVREIKNHFYDDFIKYILRCILDPTFTDDDVIQTEQLFKGFFKNHKKNIRIIFDHFFEDLKPFILKNNFPYMVQFRKFIDVIPNICLRESTIFLLETYGASYLTSLMYQNHMKNSENEGTNSVNQWLSQQLLFFICLCAIYFFEKLCLVFYYLLWLICIMLVFLFFRILYYYI